MVQSVGARHGLQRLPALRAAGYSALGSYGTQRIARLPGFPVRRDRARPACYRPHGPALLALPERSAVWKTVLALLNARELAHL